MENKKLLPYQSFHSRIASKPDTAILNELASQSMVEGIPLTPLKVACLLFTLARKISPRNIIEIGTGFGYSCLLLALASKESNITTIEYNSMYVDIAQKFFKRFKSHCPIRVIKDNALNAIRTLNGTFDFVFLDAAKEEYVDYIKLLLPHLSEGAMIIADDVFFNGERLGKVLHAVEKEKITSMLWEFRQYLEKKPYFLTSFFPIDCGVSVTLLIHQHS
jgi:predicted O-methyltransferase YrrM